MKLEESRVAHLDVWVKWMVVALVVTIIDYSGNLSGLRKVMEKGIGPAVATAFAGKEKLSRWREKAVFVNKGAIQMVDLERRVAELSATAARVGDLEKENRNLREQLGAKVGEVSYGIGRVVSVGQGEVIVDFGEDLPRKDDIVVWKNVLVGSVIDVGGRLVRVRTVEEMGEVRVIIVSSSGVERARGAIAGTRSSHLFLTGVLQESEFASGDQVITSGEDGKLPRGLLVGEVAEIVSKDSSVYREGLVKQPVSLNDYDVLYWLKGWRF